MKFLNTKKNAFEFIVIGILSSLEFVCDLLFI